MELLVVILAGALIGVVTGLLPGLHVNTLAAIALSIQPSGAAALLLVAIGVVHTIVTILPATYLGIPADDTALATLPAHRMTLDGRGPDAVRVSVYASLLALVVAIVALLPFRWLLAEPGRLAPVLESTTPWVMMAVLLLLLWQQPRPAAAAIMCLAGALGLLALDWPVRGVIAPASPMLPLLTGLFAVPTLMATTTTRIVWQRPPSRAPIRENWAIMRGVGVSAFTAVMPGLTAAVATSIAQPSRATDGRRVIAILSAVNTAHLVFAIAVLWILGKTRSGLAQVLAPTATTWTGPLSIDLWQVLVVLVAAAMLGALATRALEPAFRRLIQTVSMRLLAWSAIAAIVALVAALTGPWGLALLAKAALIGQLPLVYQTRRVHLAAVLIIPILVRTWP